MYSTQKKQKLFCNTTTQQHNKFSWLAKLQLVMFVFTISSALLFTSCQKDLSNQSETSVQSQTGSKIPENFFKQTTLPGVVLNSGNTITQTHNPSGNNAGGPSNPNNGDEQVLLGNQLPNPYTVANMQNAYNILYGQGYTITANHLYVRFKPANEDQLGILEDDGDLELQDFPMDYAITQDGDYYQDPNLGTEDISWLYAVVPDGYIPPAGIQYQLLCPLYIPDNNTMLEGMAESIVDSTYSAVATYSVSIENGVRVIRRTDIEGIEPMYPPPCDDPGLCAGGGGDNPPPPPTPPPGIYVEDQRACGTANTNTTVPLRIARVVCKRWFKIWRGYTNDLGRFTVTKTFRNNVKVIIKTKNNLAKISKVRGVRLWQMAFPVKRRIGVFAGNQLATLRYVFTKPVNANANNAELPYWVAATTHNSNIEFRDYSSEFGLAQPPSDLRIIISNWGGGFSTTGAAPMFNKCNGAMTTYFAGHFIMSQSFLVAGDLNTLVASIVNRIDVIINYQAPLADYNCRLTSTWMKELAYHELGHASHYAQAGCDFWTAYRTAIATELSKTNQTNFHPYGTGNDPATAPVLAIGEMWGNHCQYVYSNRHYGNGGTAANEFNSFMQGTNWFNAGSTASTNQIATLNCHLAAIESFNPNSTNDTWPWIPQGLPYDLFDPRNDNNTNTVIDNVVGYTYQQSFNALQSDIRSIPAFRDRLLQLNGNNQQAQVNALFIEYNY